MLEYKEFVRRGIKDKISMYLEGKEFVRGGMQLRRTLARLDICFVIAPFQQANN